MSAKYCAHCGAPLHPDVRFCTQCGRPVQAPSAAPEPAPQGPADVPVSAPPPAAAYTAEPILDIVPAIQRRKGVLGMRVDTLNLILTPTRMVFVPVTSKEMNDAVRTARDNAKAQGRGWLGQIAAQMAWVDVVCDRYRSMPVDAVLARYPDSFYILNNQVSRIRFRETVHDDDATPDLQMIVESTGGKYRFDVSKAPGGDVKRRLRQALPQAVR